MTALSRIEGVGSRHTRTSASRLALWLRYFSAAVVVIFGKASAQAQLDWRLVNPKLTSAAYGNSRYVVLEERNWIWTSDDMSIWSRHSIGFDSSPTSVAFGNGAFVTVGGANGGGFILRSTNGVDWSEQSFADGSKRIFVAMTSVVFVNGQFMAVGGCVNFYGLGVILSSPDGVTWTEQFGTPFAGGFVGGPGVCGVAFGNNTYVAVRAGQVISPPVTFYGDIIGSTNSSPWTEIDGPTPGVLWDVVFGNATFVAVGDAGVRTSTGGRWASLTNSPALRSVAFGKGIFVGIGVAGDIKWSADGLSWTNQPSGTAAPLSRVVFINNRFVALGDSATILSSPDGIEWHLLQSNYAAPFGGIAFGKGVFVASGWSSMKTSSNGLAWTVSPVGTNILLKQVAYGADKFVVVGVSYGPAQADEAALLTSPDGVAWHRPPLPFAYEFSSVIFAKELFVVGAGYHTPLMISRDGEAWEIRDQKVQATVVAYGNGTFVGLGGGLGSPWRSPDGIAWEASNPQATFPGVEAGGLAFGKGVFVAVDPNLARDYNSRIFTSTNGLEWQLRLATKWPEAYHTVNYVNGVFIAGGEGVIATSLDGLTWTRRPAIFNKSAWYDAVVGVSFGNDIFVALSATGEVHISPISLFLQAGQHLPNTPFHFDVSGGVSQGVSVQASSNLKDWTTIMTLPTPSSSSPLVDSTATNFSSRFYRAISPSP